MTIDGRTTRVESSWAFLVPSGARHNVFNTGTMPLKLYTLYSPPQHADGTVHPTKADAMAGHEHHASP